MKVKDVLGCKDHENMQFKILREVRQISESQVWTSGEQTSAYSGTSLIGSHGIYCPGGQRGPEKPTDLQGQYPQSTRIAQPSVLLQNQKGTPD